MKTITRLALAVALAGLAAPAFAQTVSTTFSVTATVIKTCQIANPTTLAFGSYDTMATTDLAGTAQFDFRCNRNTAYRIAIDNGGHFNTAPGFATDRAMQGATVTGDFLAYRLYRDAAHTLAWGSTLGTNSLDGTAGSSATTTQTIYGLIPQGQDVTAQAYSDATVTITVNY